MFEQLGRLIGFTRRSNENLSPERKQEIEDIMNAQRALLDGVKEVVVCANSFDLGKRTFLILNEDGTGAARIREHRLTRVPASK